MNDGAWIPHKHPGAVMVEAVGAWVFAFSTCPCYSKQCRAWLVGHTQTRMGGSLLAHEPKPKCTAKLPGRGFSLASAAQPRMQPGMCVRQYKARMWEWHGKGPCAFPFGAASAGLYPRAAHLQPRPSGHARFRFAVAVDCPSARPVGRHLARGPLRISIPIRWNFACLRVGRLPSHAKCWTLIAALSFSCRSCQLNSEKCN